MLKEGIYYSIEELEMAQAIISLLGEEVSIDEALEIYEEMQIVLFN